MKKIIIILFAALFAVTFTSCNRNDHWINKYEQAINAGDYQKAAQYLDKIDRDKLTLEQTNRLADITTGGAYNSVRSGLLQLSHELGEELNEDMEDFSEDYDDYED